MSTAIKKPRCCFSVSKRRNLFELVAPFVLTLSQFTHSPVHPFFLSSLARSPLSLSLPIWKAHISPLSGSADPASGWRRAPNRSPARSSRPNASRARSRGDRERLKRIRGLVRARTHTHMPIQKLAHARAQFRCQFTFVQCFNQNANSGTRVYI